MEQISLATPADLEKIYPLRAAEWHWDLTPEQHCERNRRMARHPFAKDHVRPYVLWESPGIIGSSMQVLKFEFWVKRSVDASVQRLPGSFIESVVTPPEKRKKGYAGRLLAHYFDENPEFCGALSSHVGPKPYQPVGFVECPRSYRTVSTSGAKPTGEPALSLSLKEFCERLTVYRRQKVESSGSAPVTSLVPNPLFWDWIASGYRYRGECRGLSVEEIRVELPHGEGHWLSAIPRVTTGTLDCQWITEGCHACLAFALGEAARLGLGSIAFWASPGEGSPRCQMVRFPKSWRVLSGSTADIQLGDDW
jgi:hypothetical protein